MKPESTRKLISGCAIFLGLAWLSFFLFHPVRSLIQNGGDGIGASFFTAVAPVGIPGILLLGFGLRLYRSMSLIALKWITGTIATVLVLLISSSLAIVLPEAFPEDSFGFLLILLCTLAILPTYIFVVRTLLKYLNEDIPSKVSFLSRGMITLLCWQLWIFLFTLLQNAAPKEDQLVRTITMIAPVGIAYGVFRLATWKLNQLRES